jgi:hypothetical protein
LVLDQINDLLVQGLKMEAEGIKAVFGTSGILLGYKWQASELVAE